MNSGGLKQRFLCESHVGPLARSPQRINRCKLSDTAACSWRLAIERCGGTTELKYYFMLPSAQKPEDQDEKDVKAYILNEDKFKQLTAGYSDVAACRKQNREVWAQLTADPSYADAALTEKAKMLDAKVPQCTALLKKHSTNSKAEYTGLRDRITPNAAPMSTAAKIKKRIVGNISDTAHRRRDPPQSWLHSARRFRAIYPCS